jgi:alanyl-tRNA synthetase
MEVVVNMASTVASPDVTREQLEAAFNEINELKIPEQLKFKKEILSGASNFEEVENKIRAYQQANSAILKSLEKLKRQEADGVGEELKEKIENINGVSCLIERVDLDADSIKNIGFKLKKENDNLFMVLGSAINGKAMLTVIISDDLIKERDLDASKIIRELATEIQGGGGGQPFYATAGGKNVDGIDSALEKAKSYIE